MSTVSISKGTVVLGGEDSERRRKLSFGSASREREGGRETRALEHRHITCAAN